MTFRGVCKLACIFASVNTFMLLRFFVFMDTSTHTYPSNICICTYVYVCVCMCIYIKPDNVYKDEERPHRIANSIRNPHILSSLALPKTRL
jgi:hypothetical protein